MPRHAEIELKVVPYECDVLLKGVAVPRVLAQLEACASNQHIVTITLVLTDS